MAKALVYAGSLDGSAPVYKRYLVNDTQTLKDGYVVVFSSNKISAAADQAAAGTVAGVCNTDLTTTTAGDDDFVSVDINPSSIYTMTYAGTATPAIGAKYNFTTAPYTLDSDDTTNGFLQVVDYPDTTAKTVQVILCHRAFGMT